MVKMSLDHVQVMTGQVKEMKVAPSANGDSSRGLWEKKEFERDDLGLTTTPKPVSPEKRHPPAVSEIQSQTHISQDPQVLDLFSNVRVWSKAFFDLNKEVES